jgi:hypothetical protein
MGNRRLGGHQQLLTDDGLQQAPAVLLRFRTQQAVVKVVAPLHAASTVRRLLL